ncbi:hypothetical protein D3C73_481510 [compost metagenome]
MLLCSFFKSWQFDLFFHADHNHFSIAVHDFMVGSTNQEQIFTQFPNEPLVKELSHLSRIMKSVKRRFEKILFAAEATKQRLFAQAGCGGDFHSGCAIIAFFRNEMDRCEHQLIIAAQICAIAHSRFSFLVLPSPAYRCRIPKNTVSTYCHYNSVIYVLSMGAPL